MKPVHLISDADGVLIDSQSVAWTNAEKISRLFSDIEPFTSSVDYKLRFGREAQTKLVGEEESETLRAMHRLLMRHTFAGQKVFPGVLELYSTIAKQKTIVT